MARTVLPGFATLSEFVAGLNGDCGPTATLAALHLVDPARWPLSPAGLKALDSDEIANGFAEANGAQNIPSLAGYLDRVGVRHTTYGYDTCTVDLVHATLKALAGVKPIIVEWSNAGALPGDEPGVHFHFSTCGGIDTGPAGDGIGGGYLWCDGDNRADDPGGQPRPPVLYTWGDIQAAQPIAMVVVEYPQQSAGGQAQQVITLEKNAAGVTTGAHDEHGNHVGAGIAIAIDRAGQLGETLRIGEQNAAGAAFAATQSSVYTWSPAHNDNGVALRADGVDLAAVVADRTLAAAQAQAQLSAATAANGHLQDQLTAAQTANERLQAQLTADEAKLAQAAQADQKALDAEAAIAALKKAEGEL